MFKKDPLQIITFQSYGTDTHFYVRGRALEDETIDLDQKGLFRLFINSRKCFESDEIKHAKLQLRLPNGETLTTISDNHGYFKIDALKDTDKNIKGKKVYKRIIKEVEESN